MIYSIIFTEYGIVSGIRTFTSFKSAKAILDLEMEFHREHYGDDDEGNKEVYAYIDENELNIQASFLFDSGNYRIDFMASVLE